MSGSRIWLDSQENHNPQVTPLKLRTWKRANSMLFSSCRASTWSAKRGATPRHFPVAYHSSPYTGRSGTKLGSSNTTLACTPDPKRHKVPLTWSSRHSYNLCSCAPRAFSLGSDARAHVVRSGTSQHLRSCMLSSRQQLKAVTSPFSTAAGRHMQHHRKRGVAKSACQCSMGQGST